MTAFQVILSGASFMLLVIMLVMGLTLDAILNEFKRFNDREERKP